MRPSPFLAAIALFAATSASAADHFVDVCLELEDHRIDIGDGTTVPLREVPIELEWKDWLGVWWRASGAVATDIDDGCAHMVLSGVPASTSIRARFALQDSGWQVAEFAAVYGFALMDEVAVTTHGDRADLGRWLLGEDLDADGATADDVDAFGALTLWQTVQDYEQRYESLVGPWPGFFVGVNYPTTAISSYATGTSINIKDTHWTTLSTVAHELQHTIQFFDSGIPIIPAYCTDLAGVSPYPFDPPYEYLDPATFPACTHTMISHEGFIEANHEGQADFAEEFFVGEGNCDGKWNTRNVLDDDSMETWSLNFDNDFRETNVAAAMCDAVDSGGESVTYKHLWSSDGAAANSFDGPQFTTDAASANSLAIAAQDADIYQLDLVGTADIHLMDLSAALGYTFEPSRVALGLGYRFCAITSSAVVCGKVNDSTSLLAITPPSTTGSIVDAYFVGTRLYLLTQNTLGTSRRVHTANLSTITASPAWTLVTGTLPLDTTSIASGGASSALFAASDQAIRRCALNASSVCTAAPTLWAGNDAEYGYRRNTRTMSRFASIVSLRYIDNDLYVHDAEGVAKIALSTGSGSFEQYIGPGEDKIFLNNMTRRSIAIDAEISDGYHTGALFAKVGTRSTFHHHDGAWFDTEREDTEHTDMARFNFDDAVATYEELFCGYEDVSVAPEGLFRAYQPLGYWDSIDQLLSNAGLNATEAAMVLEINWIDRNSNACAFAPGDAVVVGSPPPETIAARSATSCGGPQPGTVAQPSDQYTTNTVAGGKIGPAGPPDPGDPVVPVGP